MTAIAEQSGHLQDEQRGDNNATIFQNIPSGDADSGQHKKMLSTSTRERDENDDDNSKNGELKVSIAEGRMEEDAQVAEAAPIGSGSGVSFGFIRIYEHPFILGDNPGGLTGPPLALDWEAHTTFELSVEEYEKSRPRRRQGHEMILTPSARTNILKKSGYSRAQIIKLTKPVNIARKLRRATVQSLSMARMHELKENIVRNMWTFGRRSRQEREISKLINDWQKDAAGISPDDSIRTITTARDDDQEEFAVDHADDGVAASLGDSEDNAL